MKTHIFLTISIIVIIIIYLIYLNLYKKKNIEGFEGPDDYIDPSQKIETLITTQANNNFDIQIWNNQTVLDSLPVENGVNFPVNLTECKAITSRDVLTQCPISIWTTPVKEYGYNHVGHILTRNFIKPSVEKIIDYRQPKTPAGSIEKNLDTTVVAGANLKDPVDYLYVGSFGKGDFNYDELTKEKYKRNLGQLITYTKNLIENINTKLNTINNNINLINVAIINKMVIYLNRIIPYVNINSANKTTTDNANEILNNIEKYERNPINVFKQLINNFQNPDSTKSLSISIKIDKISFTVDNGYLVSKITKNTPAKIRNQILNGIKINEIPSISNHYYVITFSDLQNVSQSPKIAAYTLGDNTISSANNQESSEFTSSLNLQMIIKYSQKYWHFQTNIISEERDDGITEPIILGSNDGTTNGNYITAKIFLYNQNIKTETDDNPNHPRKNILDYFIIRPPNNIITSINTDLLDNTNRPFFDGFNTTLTQIKAAFPSAFETTYRALTIWQPVPPKDYVALGFIFTNKGKDDKPTNTGIKCIPKTCVKSFNRRLWRKEDLVFIYKDETQHLHFYRNPFLNTVVVIDQNKQNGYYAGKTPEALKYRPENDSIAWECFDIVPCVKTCDYVKRLEDSLVASKDTCKAHRSFENKFFDKEETKQSIIEEENKLKKIVSDRKAYIDNLMNTLNKMMSEEELYKVIDKGLNRYKLKTDLENQRQLHGAAADKLMRTRGFEVNWTNPQDLSRFKNAITAILKGRFQNGQQQARDCPVCKLPDNPNLVQIDDLELCYGCLEDAVRELINQKKSSGEPIPAELQEIADNIRA